MVGRSARLSGECSPCPAPDTAGCLVAHVVEVVTWTWSLTVSISKRLSPWPSSIASRRVTGRRTQLHQAHGKVVTDEAQATGYQYPATGENIAKLGVSHDRTTESDNRSRFWRITYCGLLLTLSSSLPAYSPTDAKIKSCTLKNVNTLAMSNDHPNFSCG